MHLSNNIPVISQDAATMLALGERIAARRREEQNTLPAPEGWAREAKGPRILFSGVTIIIAAIIITHLALAAASLFTQP